VSRLVQRQPTDAKVEQDEEEFTLTGEQEPHQLEDEQVYVPQGAS
jgi:hypothetical protein